MFLERPLGTGVFLKNVNLMKHFSTLFKCDVGKLHSKF